MIDFRNYDRGDEITVELDSGEQFTGVISGYDHDRADGYTKGYVSASFEGDFWKQVNDRVDDEVLRIEQNFGRTTKEPQQPILTGSIWVGDGIKEPQYTELGEIVAVEAT